MSISPFIPSFQEEITSQWDLRWEGENATHCQKRTSRSPKQSDSDSETKTRSEGRDHLPARTTADSQATRHCIGGVQRTTLRLMQLADRTSCHTAQREYDREHHQYWHSRVEERNPPKGRAQHIHSLPSQAVG